MVRVARFATLLIWCLASWVGAGPDDDAARPQEVDDPPAEVATTPRFEGETVVTATRTERRLDELPVSVTVVDGAELEHALSLQLDDVLRTVPGVVIPLGTSTTQHPTTHLLSMRGLGGSRALMLLDGLPVNDPFFGYIPWSMLPIGGVERVEVVRGGSSSLFGSYALGGTVNVITRVPETAGFTAQALLGTQGTTRAHLAAARPIGERVMVDADVAFTDTDGFLLLYPPEDRGEIDAPSSAESLNVRLGARVEGERWRCRLTADGYTDDTTGTTRLSVQSAEVLRLAARFHRPIADGGSFDGAVFLHDGEFATQNTSLVPGMGRDAEYVSNRHLTPAQEVGSTLQWSRPMSALVPLLTVGLDLRRTSGEDRADYLDQDGALTGGLVGGGTQVTGGLFGEASLMPTPRLEVLVSARVDHWSNRDGEERSTEAGVTRFDDRTSTEVNPKLAVHYGLGRGLGLRGAVYRAFRAPTLDELYRSFASQTLEVLANPELEPEILTGGEIGLDLARPGLEVQLNLYHAEVDGLIARSFAGMDGAVRVFEAVNLARIRSRGLEAMADVVFGEHWSAGLGYTFMDSTITRHRSEPARQGNRVADVPEHLVSVMLRHRTESGAVLTLRGRWVGEQFADDANQLRIEPHTVLDASVSWPLGRGFELQVIGENLADEEYVAYPRGGDKLGLPRRVVAGVRYTSAGWR